jgi:hypothetical protein
MYWWRTTLYLESAVKPACNGPVRAVVTLAAATKGQKDALTVAFHSIYRQRESRFACRRGDAPCRGRAAE